MEHKPSAKRLGRLYLSAVGFALLCGALTLLYLFIIGDAVNHTIGNVWAFPRTFGGITSWNTYQILTSFLIPSLLAATLSWWLLVVLPQRPNTILGLLAGLLTIILATLGFVISLIISLILASPPNTSVSLGELVKVVLFFWGIGLLIVAGSSWGWGMLALAVTAGALYGWFIRHTHFASTTSAQAAPASAPRLFEQPNDGATTGEDPAGISPLR